MIYYVSIFLHIAPILFINRNWSYQEEILKCGEQEFKCGNDTSKCISRLKICDNVPDCIDNSDENDCSDKHQIEFWDNFYSKRPDEDREKKLNSECSLFPVPAKCFCAVSSLFCVHQKMTALPHYLPKYMTELDVSGNSFNNLGSNLFGRNKLFHLEKIILTHCRVKIISPEAFEAIPQTRIMYLSNNYIQTLRNGIFSSTQNLEILDLSYNKLHIIEKKVFNNLGQLHTLNIQHCELKSLKPGTFFGLKKLNMLKLDGNSIEYLPSNMFKDLVNLQLLSLTQNKIQRITEKSFTGLMNLERLFLTWNKLHHLKNNVFSAMKKLRSLNLDGNEIQEIDVRAFVNLTQLTSLNLKNNPFQVLHKNTLTDLSSLEYIYLPDFRLCVHAISIARVCQPKGDGISSIDHLLDNIVLRISVWLVAIMSCCGNIFVLVSRFIVKEQNEVHGFFIKNLSVADLLMGLYLLIIASYDAKFRGEYIKQEENWRKSWQCHLSGFISTLSSQVSVFILTTITADRYFSVIYPLTQRRRTVRLAAMFTTSLWLVALLLSALPLSQLKYYGKQFYGSNGVCLPLQIHEPYAKAWEYSTFMFVGINLCAFFFILIAYINMFVTITTSNLSLRSNQQKKDTTIAKRFAFIVGTDFVCWMPIIFVKLLSMTGVSIDADLYAWIAIFVLPVNSALNPILYTITTKVFRQRLNQIILALFRRQSSCSPSHDPTSASLSSLFNQSNRNKLKNLNTKSTNATNTSLLSRYSRCGRRETCHSSDVTTNGYIPEKRHSCTRV